MRVVPKIKKVAVAAAVAMLALAGCVSEAEKRSAEIDRLIAEEALRLEAEIANSNYMDEWEISCLEDLCKGEIRESSLDLGGAAVSANAIRAAEKALERVRRQIDDRKRFSKAATAELAIEFKRKVLDNGDCAQEKHPGAFYLMCARKFEELSMTNAMVRCWRIAAESGCPEMAAKIEEFKKSTGWDESAKPERFPAASAVDTGKGRDAADFVHFWYEEFADIVFFDYHMKKPSAALRMSATLHKMAEELSWDDCGEEKLALLEYSASNHVMWSQKELADVFAHGRPHVAQSVEKAAYWYRLTAERYDAESVDGLIEIVENGRPDLNPCESMAELYLCAANLWWWQSFVRVCILQCDDEQNWMNDYLWFTMEHGCIADVTPKFEKQKVLSYLDKSISLGLQCAIDRKEKILSYYDIAAKECLFWMDYDRPPPLSLPHFYEWDGGGVPDDGESAKFGASPWTCGADENHHDQP